MMSERQRIWFMADIWPATCKAQGWNKTDSEKRYDLFARVLGHIPRHARTLAAGRHISFNDFDQPDFDAVKAECLALADNLKGAVETVRPDYGEERRLRHQIAQLQKCLALYIERPDAYLRPILAAKFKGRTSIDDLSAVPVLKDAVGRGSRRAHVGPSELARALMALRTVVQQKRNAAGHSVHEMNLLAGIPCPCKQCQAVPTHDNQPF
jgi:hypothetical protein